MAILSQAQPAAAELHELKINRLILARYKADYAKLMEQQTLHPTATRERQLGNLGYKIQAMNEDIERLLTPTEKEARSFLNELTSKNKEGAPELAKIVPTSELHEKALEFVSNNDLKEAVRVYEEIVLSDPDDDQAYLLMGHCLLLSGAYEKAENAFYHAVSIDPRNREEIIPFYENAVLQYPDDDSARADLGYARLILGDYLKAKQAFNDAVEINPSSEKALKGIKIIQASGN